MAGSQVGLGGTGWAGGIFGRRTRRRNGWRVFLRTDTIRRPNEAGMKSDTWPRPRLCEAFRYDRKL